ncbi:hypothetical protein BWQ96_07551 [Gracilariopsis chorda]|uniref:Aminoglycoside phosphotransferase domain-containing protein n=1 Tax=Gracilariopsis chorda TaxID=448386 RepID=A0A2V3IKX9_9FLOR|nr:hypothetical protein BWQ96_07551 [Gracilariopsis chorda]|eukprot:PXF42736.1 hypothetical protein BWQ96_07551 [Gracilariopsis chorda]
MAEENTHEELFYEKFPYEIRFLLLGKNRRKVLMTRDGGEWDLPVVEYQSKSGRNLATRCCHDMGKAFSGECEVRFAAVIELLGKWLVWSRKKKKKRAHAMLVLAECVSHEDVENLVLPHDSEWKNSSFVSSILSAYKENIPLRSLFALVAGAMAPSTELLSSFKDPRYKFGWYRKAASLLTSTAVADCAKHIGTVSQVQVSETSTVLRTESSLGYYYLKSPTHGCEETSITHKVAELLPLVCPEVLNICTSLNCFVTRGLGLPIKQTEYRVIVRKLGYLHFESLSHIEKLRSCGCPVRDLDKLSKKIDVWAEGREFTRGDPIAEQQMRELKPLLKRMCAQLASLDIPLTLIHGDVARSNSARTHTQETDALLFDWEFACISHPLFDFHRIADESKDSIMIDEYLIKWFPLEQLEEARNAYEIGVHLGYFVKVWALSDRLEESAPQLVSPLAFWARELLRDRYWALVSRIADIAGSAAGEGS